MIHYQNQCSVELTRGCVVVGQEELDARSVNIRNRDDVGTKARASTVPLDEVVEKMIALKSSRKLENRL